MPTYTRTQRLQDSILSVKPLTTESFSEVEVYAYQSKGAPPNVIHANDPLITPDGTALSSSALFFQATIQNAQNPPTFSQLVIDGASGVQKIAISAATSSVSSTTATIAITTSSAHGLQTGDLVDIDIGDTTFNTNPNGVHSISRDSDTNFRYNISVASGTSNDTYTINSDAFMSKAILVHQFRDYYKVTDPGTLTIDGATSNVTIGSSTPGVSSGSATVFPKVSQSPRSYRKSGLTKLFLTALSRPTPEVAYQNEDVDFVSVAFRNSSSSSSGDSSFNSSHKTFDGYLAPAVVTLSISAASGIGDDNEVTITTSSSHGFGVGDTVTIANLGTSTENPNGDVEITALGASDGTNTETKFRYALTMAADRTFSVSSPGSPTAALNQGSLNRSFGLTVAGSKGTFSCSAVSEGVGTLTTEYNKTGVFQSKVTPFNKSTDGQSQFFIKTDISF